MAHDAKFGALIDEHQRRDAIHVAIAPVVASERLRPGDHVGFCGDDTTLVGKTLPGITPIGIIDPFLRRSVKKGERCWLLLYQQTITSLRHEWSHPAFPAEMPTVHALSRDWIRGFAEQHDETYDSIMEAAANYVERGTYFSKGGKFEGEWVPDEFWTHYQLVTGRIVENTGSFFSCSC